MEALPKNIISNAVVQERQILGAAMLDQRACAEAIELMKPEHFVELNNRRLFDTVCRLFMEGHPVNLGTLAEHSEASASFLADLQAECASTVNVRHDAMIVIERWMARSAVDLLTKTIAQLREGDVFDTLDELQQGLSDVQAGHFSDTRINSAVEQARSRMADWKRGIETDFAPSGFYSLDRAFGGFPVGELTTFAAQSGAGKTSFAIQCIAAQALRQANSLDPKALLLFSCEMTAEQIVHRAASNMSRVDLSALRSGTCSEDKFARFERALDKLSSLPIHIDDSPSPTLSQIIARCQQISLSEGLAFVCVDYDEKLDAPGQTEELRVSGIAQGLKNAAKRFKAPFLCLSQYSKSGEESYGVPSDRWLRYSGKKLQESALVLHWHSPGFWVGPKGVPPQNVSDFDPEDPLLGFIYCTKNRFGKGGRIKLRFDPETTRFIDPSEPKEFN